MPACCSCARGAGTMDELHVFNIYNKSSLADIQAVSNVHSKPLQSVAISMDGLRVVSADDEGKVFAFHLLTGRSVRTQIFNRDTKINDVCFLADNQSVICCTNSKELVVIAPEARHGKVVHVLKRTGRTLSLSPAGTHLAVGLHGNESGLCIIIFTVKDFVQQDSLHVKTDPAQTMIDPEDAAVNDLHYSPCSSFLVSGHRNGVIRMWSMQNHQIIWACKGHTKEIFSVCFSPDGTLIATGSRDKAARVWDALTGNCFSFSFPSVEH